MEGWQPSEIHALWLAIHHNHVDYIDGVDCCHVDFELEVCPAHSLLDDQELLERMLWSRRLYRHWVRTNYAIVKRRYNLAVGEQLRPGPLVQ